MQKTIIIDCVGDSMSKLVKAINKTLPNANIVGISTNCSFGLTLIQKHKASILFIRSKKSDYIELSRKVKEKGFNPYFIFVTETEFEINNLDDKSLTVCLQHLENSIIKISHHLTVEEPSPYTNRIGIPSNNGTTYLSTDNIIFFRSDNNYTIIHLENGKTILVSKTLKKFEVKLSNKHFIRTHQSYIVNLNKVIQVCNNDGGYLTMNNNEKIPISRSKKNIVKNQLNLLFEKI